MDRTVAHLNVERFRKMLEVEVDEAKRQTILRLLAEEEAKVAKVMAAKTNPKTATEGDSPTPASESATHQPAFGSGH
jgi:hypothetical protein